MSNDLLRSLRLRALGTATAVMGLAFTVGPAASAQAALISTGVCNSSALSQPFLAWGDSSDYELAPSGDFSTSSPAWTLTNGAVLASEAEPASVPGTAGNDVLSLPTVGATGQSPYTCVNTSYPTLRFFARNNSLTSTILVSAIFRSPVLGLVTAPVPLGVVALNGSWQPSTTMLTASTVAALSTGGTAQMALRFTALTGSSEVDDVFIDPRMN